MDGSPGNEDYNNEYLYTQAQLETGQLFFNLISYFCCGETFSSILDMLGLLSLPCPDYKVTKVPVIAGETIFLKNKYLSHSGKYIFLFLRLYFLFLLHVIF